MPHPIFAEAVAVLFAAYTVVALLVPAFRPGVLIVAATWLAWRCLNLALAVRVRRRMSAPKLARVNISAGPVIDAPPLSTLDASGLHGPDGLAHGAGYGGTAYGGGVYGG